MLSNSWKETLRILEKHKFPRAKEAVKAWIGKLDEGTPIPDWLQGSTVPMRAAMSGNTLLPIFHKDSKDIAMWAEMMCTTFFMLNHKHGRWSAYNTDRSPFVLLDGSPKPLGLLQAVFAIMNGREVARVYRTGASTDPFFWVLLPETLKETKPEVCEVCCHAHTEADTLKPAAERPGFRAPPPIRDDEGWREVYEDTRAGMYGYPRNTKDARYTLEHSGRELTWADTEKVMRFFRESWERRKAQGRPFYDFPEPGGPQDFKREFVRIVDRGDGTYKSEAVDMHEDGYVEVRKGFKLVHVGNSEFEEVPVSDGSDIE